MQFCFGIGKFQIKTQCCVLHFYLDLKNETWVGPVGCDALTTCCSSALDEQNISIFKQL
jgi:hypothetical protein